MHMNRSFLSVAATAAFLSLAACNSEPEPITAGDDDPQAAELAKATPKQLPPSIVASRTYRCKDNSLVYVDFMSDKKTVNFRAEKGAAPTVLTAPEEGQPFVAEGYSLSGTGDTITLTRPGKGEQACHA